MPGRPTSLTTRMTELAMDVHDQMFGLAMRDGHICPDEERVLIGIKRLRNKTERLDISRRIARTVEDAGGLTPHAIRLDREMVRDLTPVLMLSPNLARTSEFDGDISA